MFDTTVIFNGGADVQYDSIFFLFSFGVQGEYILEYGGFHPPPPFTAFPITASSLVKIH
jgi:hypothetical protein